MNDKLEWIRLKKKVETMSDLNPLTLNIETIFTLPETIKVTDDDGTIPPKNPFKEEIRKQREADIISIVREVSKKPRDSTLIFKDSLDPSTQISSKEAIYANINVTSGKASVYNFSHSLTLPS